MNIKLIALLVTPLLALSTGAAATSRGAGAEPTQTIRHLKVVFLSDFDTRDGFVAIGKDLNPNGKRVGSDVTTCRGKRTHPEKARCDVALALNRGIILITFTMTADSDTAHGVVTGGTGAFRDTRGTVVIHEHPKHADVVLTLID